jgi:hypothetical protein
LVTVEGVREELGKVKWDRSRSAADVFNGRAMPLKMLVPQASGGKSKLCKPMGLDGEDKSKGRESYRPDDLSWYDEYVQQKVEGKWDKEPIKPRESELKSVLSDRWAESRESTLGTGARTLRMKPSTYDGLTPYEDYRVQFHMMAELNGWDKTAKALYLAGCLSKGARSVLNDLRHEDRYDYDKLDEALRERYGTEDQAELLKAKLRSRVKSKEESLQELAHDIRRLVRLAYPKAAMRTHDDMTKDQFIEALGDGEIRWSVFQSRPKNITEALKVAMELEAFKESEKSRLRKSVRSIKQESDGESESDLSRVKETEGIKKLELSVQQVIAQIGQLQQKGSAKEGSEEFDKGVMRKPTAWEERKREGGGRVNETGYRGPFDINKVKCFRCGKMGHYARECSEMLAKSVEVTPTVAAVLNE